MDHDELRELLPLEAMGRLDEGERAALDAHLREGCDECAAELRDFREMVAAIAVADSEAVAGDPVWARLEARLRGSRASERAPARSGRRVFPLARVALAASLFLAVLAGYFAYQVRAIRDAASARDTQMQARLDDLAQLLRQRDAQLAAFQSQMSQSGELTRALLAPDVRLIKLGPMPGAPDARGVVAMPPRPQAHCMAAVIGLPPAPPDKTYELWWIGAKRGPMRAATFTTAAHGGAIISPSRPPQDEPILASAVTLEPRGGSDRPTGPMYLKGLSTE